MDETFPVGAGQRLQVVVAHPDDETFGCGSILLHAAAEGAVTAVCCATRGELGEVASGVTLPAGGLAELREAELREAARLMGVSHVELLDFGDSGMDGEPPSGSLAGADPARVEAAVARAVDAFGPDVLVTLDGSDGHRDHAAVRDATRRVAAERGLPVYLQAIPRSLLLAWAAHMEQVDPDNTYLHLGDLGTPDEQLTHRVDTSVHLEQRWRAIAAHRSQTSPFALLPDDLARRFLTADHLVRVS